MQAISMDKVKLTGAIQVEKVLDFTMTARVNEHAYLDFKGIIDVTRALEDLKQKLEGAQMCLSCGDAPYFTGKILRATIINEGEYYTVEAKCISGSYCFDLKKHCRSFQHTKMTYGEMLKTVEQKSGTGSILSIAGRDKPIGYPIIQYEETDWEFTKRMASHFGTIVIPEIMYGQPQISMGVIQGKEYLLDERTEYEISKNIDGWYTREEENDCDLKDFIFYKVKDYRNFELGDKVKLMGYPLIVMAKQFFIKNGLLEVEYELGYEQGYGLKQQYNSPICGKSIPGRVLMTAGEKLKIHLDIDEAQEIEKAYWYTWMPQTGNLLYCMPKLGTKVHLHFINQNEETAIATECVRTNNGKTCDAMRQYQSRQFVTEHNKGLVLTPNFIDFIGNSSKNINILNLVDGRGIAVDTCQNISVQSMERLSMHAEGVVEINAGSLLKLDKIGEKSGIELFGSEINKYAENIYHNGIPQDEKQALMPQEKEFPAALFAGTAAAMVPAAASDKNCDPVTMSMLGMTNINIGKFK